MGCPSMNGHPKKQGLFIVGHSSAEARSLVKTGLNVTIPRKVFKNADALAQFPEMLI